MSVVIPGKADSPTITDFVAIKIRQDIRPNLLEAELLARQNNHAEDPNEYWAFVKTNKEVLDIAQAIVDMVRAWDTPPGAEQPSNEATYEGRTMSERHPEETNPGVPCE